jgi:hypothetical protein
MMNPVAVPTAEEHKVGTTRRRPEVVALSKRTAWKKRGMLKVTVLEISDAMELPKMIPARGFLQMSFRGMIGRGTWHSTQMNRGKHMLQITSEVIT